MGSFLRMPEKSSNPQTQPNELAIKSKISPLRSEKNIDCIISNAPPYVMQNIRISHFNFTNEVEKTNARIVKICNPKNIEACTNLSKESNSSQDICGMDFPGILHKASITKNQIIAGALYLRNCMKAKVIF